MRVGMICPYSLGVWGGVQAQVLGLARQMRSAGVRVQVLAPCDGLPPEPWVTPLGNSMPYAQNGSIAPIAPDAAAQLRTLAACWDERFDVLHLHEPLAPGPTMTALLVKPVPLVGTFHAAGSIASYRWGRPVVRRMAGRLDLRVAVSAEAAGLARHSLGGRYDILFNGIDVEAFASPPPEHEIETDGPTVFFLGRHEPRKGLEVLLDSLSRLPPDIRIWVGSDGPDTERLRSLHDDDRIEWLGRMPEHEKIARLRAADVFCVPALGGESFGIVLLEAMAAGTPVVASDLEAFRLVARDGRDATLFPTGDADALAKALLAAIDRSEQVEERVASGRERASGFGLDALAEAYLARYERVLA